MKAAQKNHELWLQGEAFICRGREKFFPPPHLFCQNSRLNWKEPVKPSRLPV